MYIKFLLINFKSPIKILFGHDVTELKFDAFNFVNIIAVPPDFVPVAMTTNGDFWGLMGTKNHGD